MGRRRLNQHSQYESGRCKDCGSYWFHDLRCPIIFEGTIASLIGLVLIWILMIGYWTIGDDGTRQGLSILIGVSIFTLVTTVPVLVARRRQ